MCGIHWTLNAAHYAQGPEAFMKDCFLANQVRGVDSAGMFQVERSWAAGGKVRNVDYHKLAESGTEFIKSKPAKDLFTRANAALANVGHVRAATVGGVVKENAHPFVTVRNDGSRIIGVHNGTLFGWKGKKGANDFNVDSAWLYSKLAADGIDCFEAIDGAYALIWYDSRTPNVMYVARNDKRPLFWGYSESGSVMYGASELGMLGWLMARNQIKPKVKKNQAFFYPEAGHVYAIDMTDLDKTEKTKLPTYSAASRKYDEARVHPVHHGQGIYDDSDWGGWRSHLVAGRGGAATRESRILNGICPQEEFLKGVKDVLRQGRQEELEEEVEKVKAKKQTVEPLASDGAIDEASFLWIHKPELGSVSKEEEELAKKHGMFGLVVNFCGYFFDPDGGYVYGDFRTKEDGKTLQYDAILRGISEKYAEDSYIHPTKTTRMVVVGVYTEKERPFKQLLVLEDVGKCKNPVFMPSPPDGVDRDSVTKGVAVH